jgi:hypothetical protein
MLSNHELPYVGRFACDWHRLATTDPHGRVLDRDSPLTGFEVKTFGINPGETFKTYREIR